MAEDSKINKFKIDLDNREILPPKRSFGQEKIRSMFFSFLLSFFFLGVILVTLPLTVLSVPGLIVYASIVALVVFLFVLLIRYFLILWFAYFYGAKYSNEKKKPYYPFISIIVPVFNEAKTVRNTVESLLRLDYPNYEIVVVNDGSKDGTKEIASGLVGYHEGKYSKVKLSLINKPNGGKSKALNAGIQYSEADFVLCVDGDSQLAETSLKEGMKHFTDPRVGAVAGNVKILNRNHILTDLQALEYIEGLNMPRSAQGFLKLVNIIPGPIGFFRRETLFSAGLYSSDTFAEDADITLKVLQKGWKIAYEPRAVSYTEAPQTLNQLLKQRYRWTRGIIQSVRKHKKYIQNPTINFNNSLVLWYMFYEALIWPVMDIFATLFFVAVALIYGMSSLIFFWWITIAVLDMMGALYCIAVEKEEFRLVPYAVVYRMIFILLIDVTKFMATIEEFLGVKMSWGKLKRLGTVKI